jgi:AraC family transcriptional regulator
MQRAFDYIDEHLDEDLSVGLLSDIAAFSKHHFHRQFSELFRLRVHRYIQLTPQAHFLSPRFPG